MKKGDTVVPGEILAELQGLRTQAAITSALPTNPRAGDDDDNDDDDDD